jgi:hypothetical protein
MNAYRDQHESSEYPWCVYLWMTELSRGSKLATCQVELSGRIRCLATNRAWAVAISIRRWLLVWWPT